MTCANRLVCQKQNGKKTLGFVKVNWSKSISFLLCICINNYICILFSAKERLKRYGYGTYSVDKGPLKKWTEHSNWPSEVDSNVKFLRKNIVRSIPSGGKWGPPHYVIFLKKIQYIIFCKIQFHGVFRPFVKRSLVDRCLESSIILWIPTIMSYVCHPVIC